MIFISFCFQSSFRVLLFVTIHVPRWAPRWPCRLGGMPWFWQWPCCWKTQNCVLHGVPAVVLRERPPLPWHWWLLIEDSGKHWMALELEVSKVSSNRIKLNQTIHRCQLSTSSFSFVNVSTDAAMRSTNNKEEDSLHWDFRTLELKRSSVCLSIFTSYLHLAYRILPPFWSFRLNQLNHFESFFFHLLPSCFFHPVLVQRVRMVRSWTCEGSAKQSLHRSLVLMPGRLLQQWQQEARWIQIQRGSRVEVLQHLKVSICFHSRTTVEVGY